MLGKSTEHNEGFFYLSCHKEIGKYILTNVRSQMILNKQHLHNTWWRGENADASLIVEIATNQLSAPKRRCGKYSPKVRSAHLGAWVAEEKLTRSRSCNMRFNFDSFID